MRQRDGKLIVAGERDSGGDGTGTAVVLLRYDQHGSVDASFGDGGVVTTDVAKDRSESVRAAAVMPDGRLVVLVQSPGTDYDPVSATNVVRYRADGSLDSRFGDHGILALTGFTALLSSQNLIVQPDGKILIGGPVADDPHALRITRLRVNGAIDRRFGSRGTLLAKNNDAENWLGNDTILRAAGDVVHRRAS